MPKLTNCRTKVDDLELYEGLLSLDDSAWMSSCCVIQDKAGESVPLTINRAQMIVMRVINKLRSLDVPVRLIVLKARQEGISTLGLGLGFCRANKRSNHNFLMAAHKKDAAVELFKKVRRFQDHMRLDMKLPERTTSRTEVAFDQPHYSSCRVATAGDEDLGRSGTVQDFHGSEVAFWKTAKSSMNAVMQCIPDLPDTTAILESTANGLGGEFYDRWCNAVPFGKFMSDDPEEVKLWNQHTFLPKGDGGFVAIFLPWHIFPEYSTPATPDFKLFEAHEDYGNEVALAQQLGLTDDQMQWRRRTIDDKCGKSLDIFHQEYPSTDQEAFLVSGRPVFSQQALQSMARRTEPADMRGTLSADKDGDIVFISDEEGVVEVWESPLEGEYYGIGADTAEGLDPDESNDPDGNSAHCIKGSQRSVVAKVSGQIDPDIFSEQIDLLGRWYNEALLGVEVNNSSGGTVRECLKRLDYPNLYWRESWDEIADKPTRKVGWYTDKGNRGRLIDDMVQQVRRRAVHCPSEGTVKQMQTFVKDKMGRPGHAPGEHDDDVISLCIAWQMVIANVDRGGETSSEYAGEILSVEMNRDFRPEYVIGGCEDESKYLDRQEEIELERDGWEYAYV